MDKMGHALQPLSCGINTRGRGRERERPSLRARLLLRSGMHVWVVVVVVVVVTLDGGATGATGEGGVGEEEIIDTLPSVPTRAREEPGVINNEMN